MTRSTGLQLPSLPGPVCSLLQKVVGDDTPPQLYSGATVQVQRAQRTDEIERMMNEMQRRRHRRVIRIGRPEQGQLPQPSEDQVLLLQFAWQVGVHIGWHPQCNFYVDP